ncbi:hypothetical protein GCM10010116_55780 [Microbispora rosea subsp. aerata]|nr:hypothetical protein GCM10010116_55780 [Microbispora rosea subsp. aerata]GIH56960.1 hypothetical protein Mro02_38740 [Microbispora rosea subsp. aerata]GLJ82887.1 hypothetical protein GCM10017588_16130 [Microbispora rosea subsp. aerata]
MIAAVPAIGRHQRCAGVCARRSQRVPGEGGTSQRARAGGPHGYGPGYGPGNGPGLGHWAWFAAGGHAPGCCCPHDGGWGRIAGCGSGCGGPAGHAVPPAYGPGAR